ncbi:MAG: glucokinase [Desulfobacterales bacterium SG8_35_2]|nr:MAG: glucokinase [Desulfobacterales bacterium SG8_35_2]
MGDHFHLAGDIGGTKTILALFSSEKGPLQPLFELSYASSSYPGLDAIIEDFYAQAKTSALTACFGVAGPVREGRAVITNLPWQPDVNQLQAAHGFSRATLINDLVATGYALPLLEKSDFFTINKGINARTGALGIIAPGTGLGEVIFTWDGSRYIAVASEGGHVDFGPSSETEARLLQFLKNRYGHVSYDRICSGRGLPAIYDFFKSTNQFHEPEWLAKQLNAAEDPAPVIVNGALDAARGCEICTATLELFISILGAEAGNLALKGLTTGGMFLGGGIPPRIRPFLENETFMKSFTSKGRMSYLLRDIPVKVILNPKAALFGAAAFGLGLRFAWL